jgi:hypothetical protein
MAKPLIFVYRGEDVTFELEKVERSKLYGAIDVESYDAKGAPVVLATLDGDGRTVIGAGGTALVTLDVDGRWREKSELTPVTLEGTALQPVPSSFNAPIPLQNTVTIDEYLQYIIRATYLLTPAAEGPSGLMDDLTAGKIFSFPFSYRGGLSPDTAFLLLNASGHPFLALGAPTRLEYIGLEQAASEDDDENEEDFDEDDVDFSMM